MPLATEANSAFTTQTNLQAPYIEEASRRLIDSVSGTEGVPGLIDTPYQNYNDLGAAGEVDPRLAGFSQDQVAGFDLAREGIGAYQPYLDKSTAALDAVQPRYDTQSGIAQKLMTGSAQDIDLQRFQNPYQRDVIDTTMLEMQRQQGIASNRDSAAAAAAGAFGG